jgi:hypothetical protein
MESKLKMLWHGNFWDYPRDGLAEYNDEKVYFTIRDEPGEVRPNNYPQEVLDLITALPDECSVGNYEITADFTVRSKLSYDIYRLPPDTLLEFETNNENFSQAVGYHNWHDPTMYKPFIAKDGWRDYRRKPIPNFDIANFIHLGTFTYDKFQYFEQPR